MSLSVLLSRGAILAVFATGLIGCALPSAPVAKTVYDFGSLATPTARPSAAPRASPLSLAEIQTAWGQSSTTMQYRLGYANDQALQPYALARWSMPPAQLVAQRVRAALSQGGPVVAMGDGATSHVLQLSLEDFGQRFETPTASFGRVHVRATLLMGDRLVAQRDFTASAPAPTPDAPGGARALAQATESLAQQLSAWVAEHTH